MCYAITKLDGLDGKVLILSYGKDNANSYIKIYQIGNCELTGLGKISTSNGSLYINNDGNMALYKAEKNTYSYGAIVVNDSGKLSVDIQKQGVVPSGGTYPDIPGAKISLYATTDLSAIRDF